MNIIDKFNDIVKDNEEHFSISGGFMDSLADSLNDLSSVIKYDILQSAVNYSKNCDIDDIKTFEEYIRIVADGYHRQELDNIGFVPDNYNSYEIFCKLCTINNVVGANNKKIYEIVTELYNDIVKEWGLSHTIGRKGYSAKKLELACTALFATANQTIEEAFSIVAVNRNSYFLTNPFSTAWSNVNGSNDYYESATVTFALMMIDSCGVHVYHENGETNSKQTFEALLGLNENFNKMLLKHDYYKEFEQPKRITKKYVDSELLKSWITHY